MLMCLLSTVCWYRVVVALAERLVTCFRAPPDSSKEYHASHPGGLGMAID